MTEGKALTGHKAFLKEESCHGLVTPLSLLNFRQIVSQVLKHNFTY